LHNDENWVEFILKLSAADTHCSTYVSYLQLPYMKHRFKRGKMVDEFVVASEKYGSGSLERKYRFSAENGNLERIGRKREIISSFRQFFKVTM